jgi:hypothetical protein
MSRKPAGLHTAKFVVQPGLVLVVYDALVQQDTGKLGEEVFKVPEVVCFYCLYFGVNPAYVLFGGQFFQKVIYGVLLKAVFDKIQPMPGKAYDQDNPRRYQQEGRRYRRKGIDYIVQNIPPGHVFNIKPCRGIGQEGCFGLFFVILPGAAAFGDFPDSF